MLVTSHESRTPGVFFTAWWRYQPSHGAFGALMVAAGVFLIGRVMLNFFQDEKITPRSIQIGAGLFLLGCMLFYLGSTLFFSLITGYAKKLTVSDNGVRMHHRYYTWGRIQWLDAQYRGGIQQLRLCLRGGLWKKRWLITDDGISPEQWEKLLQQLRERVLPHHPHLRTGDEAHLIASEDSETPHAAS
jgi:hypothetical protein